MTSIDASLLLATAAEHGVPGPVVRESMARTRPCLHLVRHGELPEPHRENARPAARTGGLLALPDGADRPDGHEPLVLRARRRVPWPVHATARADPPFSCPALPSLR
ncbi:hypothetical protein ABTY96_09620 [Streptomyces sp. NPDC096057]|uniref:hypothetical protein n=1 Tax=Streptomyces sp. NPDC096057 TaxID=3155543 RepID=UPI003320B064